MKPKDFQDLLFRSAVITIAVDGQIHESEIQEVKSIINHTAYFLDFEYEELLQILTEDIKEKGKKAVNNFLLELSETDLSEQQKLVVIDVILRMIEADKGIHPNEIEFLNLVISKINISRELLVIKFPKQVDYLVDFTVNDSNKSFDADISLI